MQYRSLFGGYNFRDWDELKSSVKERLIEIGIDSEDAYKTWIDSFGKDIQKIRQDAKDRYYSQY
jgi:hypothetical protein